MAAGDLELDVDTAGRLVAAAAGRFRVAAVERLAGAGGGAVFEVRSTDGAALVVKVYDDRWAWKMEKELFVYDLLRRRQLDLPVADVVVADGSRRLLPHGYLVLTKLEGRDVVAALDRLDDSELAAVYRQIGVVLRVLHGIELEAFGYVGAAGVVRAHATNVDYMRAQFDEKLRELERLGGGIDLRRAIERHVAEREELLAACARPALCHDDCHDGNVLVVPSPGGWRVSGVLDFENVVAGDPVLDLAKTHYYARRPSEATLAALADGHGDLRDGWREALDLYVLYHALELWVWFASLGVTEPLAALEADLRRLAAASP